MTSRERQRERYETFNWVAKSKQDVGIELAAVLLFLRCVQRVYSRPSFLS